MALIGLARARYELDAYDEADRLYSQVKALDPALASQYAYLSSTVNGDKPRQGPSLPVGSSGGASEAKPVMRPPIRPRAAAFALVSVMACLSATAQGMGQLFVRPDAEFYFPLNSYQGSPLYSTFGMGGGSILDFTITPWLAPFVRGQYLSIPYAAGGRLPAVGRRRPRARLHTEARRQTVPPPRRHGRPRPAFLDGGERRRLRRRRQARRRVPLRPVLDDLRDRRLFDLVRHPSSDPLGLRGRDLLQLRPLRPRLESSLAFRWRTSSSTPSSPRSTRITTTTPSGRSRWSTARMPRYGT